MTIKGNQFLTKVIVKVKNDGPLHIGNGEGEVLLDETTNQPFIPATSIAGTFRAFIQEFYGTEKANLVFGSHDDRHSKIYIYDAESNQTMLELRPSLKIDSKLGTALKSHKLDREYIGTGHTFHIRFELYGEDIEQISMLEQYLYQFLHSLSLKLINIGGLKTSGAGYFELLEVTQIEYDSFDVLSWSSYLKNEGKASNVTEKVLNTSIESHFAELELIGKLDTPLLIKGNNSNDHRLPDAENISNINGEFIIPGTSLKGLLRSHSKRILDYLKKEYLLMSAFGNESDSKEAIQGRVYTQDVIVKNSKDSHPYHRIKIDKFTGGVMKGALITEQPILGDIHIKVRYKCSNDVQKDNAIVGLLSLVLRDIALGNLSIGSGNNIGRGRVIGDTILLKYNGDKIEIDLSNKEEKYELMEELIQELTNIQGGVK